MRTICTNAFLVVKALLGTLIVFAAFSTPAQILGHDCRQCHLSPRQSMFVTGFQLVTNFGPGDFKVFQSPAGRNVPIGISVTNGVTRYAASFMYPFDGGLNANNHHLVYQVDPLWSDRKSFYATPTTNVNQSWTFNLNVESNTPPDIYVLTLQVAGINPMPGGTNEAWNQLEKLYVQVLPSTPPAPQISLPVIQGNTLSINVPTLNGFTYYLEFAPNPKDLFWNGIDQVVGDGATKSLVDSNRSDLQRFYRVRVQ